MPFNLFKRQDVIDYKARMERKMCVARETPEPIFDLSECNLKSVPSGVYSLCKVLRKEALFLQENLLTSLSGGGAFHDLLLLKVLDLHSNKISKLPDDLGTLINLEIFNVSENQLITLPSSIGKLKALKTLNVSNNKLKKLPASLGSCRQLGSLDVRENSQLASLPRELGTLVYLQELLVDSCVQFPPRDVLSKGAAATVAFLTTECGVVADKEEIMEKIVDLKSDTNYFLLQEKLKLIEQQKDLQKIERLAWEKSLADENQKELQFQEDIKRKRSKLVDDIKGMQNNLEGELLKIQQQKDFERNELIRQCLEAEENVNSKVIIILENAKKYQEQITQMTERERAIEEQLLYRIHEEAQCIEEGKVLDAMNQLVKEEIIKAKKFRIFEEQRRRVALNWINEESELSSRLADLATQARADSQELTEALLADEELQKAAVASLMEQSDTRSWNLAQQVALIETQLAELTQVELARKKLQQETQITELAVSRVALTELLLDLFAQQQSRRSELVAALRRMEGFRGEQPDESFWLHQYQRLLDSTSRQLVQTMEAVDPILQRELSTHGVVHYLPLIAQCLSSKVSVAALEDSDLLQVGVTDPDDRLLLRKAFKSYLETFSLVPSAPEDAYQPSAPLQSPTRSTASTDSISSGGVVARISEECVVCLEAEVNTIFLPCGHMCCCILCASLAICPLCRATVDRVLQTSHTK